MLHCFNNKNLCIVPVPPLLQVALNQLALAPITITVAFAWNLALQGKLEQLPAKLRTDFVNTIQNGWKFWVPAATVNFVAVPLQHQVGGRCWCCTRAGLCALAGWGGPVQLLSVPCVKCSPTFGSQPARLKRHTLLPAGSISLQVLYMSTCGVLWTGYLSYKSAKQ